MAYKESTEAEKEAYMEFWSERKPESFALESWLERLDDAIADFDKKNPTAIAYYKSFGRVVFRDRTLTPIHGIRHKTSLIKSRMELIHKHEEGGTSLMAVSAIIDKLNKVDGFFRTGIQKHDWAYIAAGRKRLRAPFYAEDFHAYNKYSWLNECHTAQDVAATLWGNFFSAFLTEDEEASPFDILLNAITAYPSGLSPRFTTEMKFGIASVPSTITLGEIVEMAKLCFLDIRETHPWAGELANKKADEFLLKAQAFIEKFPLRSYAPEREYDPLDAACEMGVTPI